MIEIKLKLEIDFEESLYESNFSLNSLVNFGKPEVFRGFEYSERIFSENSIFRVTTVEWEVV